MVWGFDVNDGRHVPTQAGIVFGRGHAYCVGNIALFLLAIGCDPDHPPWQFQIGNGVEGDGDRGAYLDINDFDLRQVICLDHPRREIGQLNDRSGGVDQLPGPGIDPGHGSCEGRTEFGIGQSRLGFAEGGIRSDDIRLSLGDLLRACACFEQVQVGLRATHFGFRFGDLTVPRRLFNFFKFCFCLPDPGLRGGDLGIIGATDDRLIAGIGSLVIVSRLLQLQRLGKLSYTIKPFHFVVSGLSLFKCCRSIGAFGCRGNDLIVTGAVQQIIQRGLCLIQCGLRCCQIAAPGVFEQACQPGLGPIEFGFFGLNLLFSRSGLEFFQARFGGLHGRLGFIDGGPLGPALQLD